MGLDNIVTDRREHRDEEKKNENGRNKYNGQTGEIRTLRRLRRDLTGTINIDGGIKGKTWKFNIGNKHESYQGVHRRPILPPHSGKLESQVLVDKKDK